MFFLFFSVHAVKLDRLVNPPPARPIHTFWCISDLGSPGQDPLSTHLVCHTGSLHPPAEMGWAAGWCPVAGIRWPGVAAVALRRPWWALACTSEGGGNGRQPLHVCPQRRKGLEEENVPKVMSGITKLDRCRPARRLQPQ